MLNGRALIEHAAATLAGHVDAVVIVGRNGLEDLPRPGLGPLGGIAAALHHATEGGFATVLTIGCDMPVLSDDLLSALLRQSPAFCIDAPVLGHWPAACSAHLIDHLQTAPDRSVRGWARAIGAVPVPALSPIANVNTPADLARLAQHVAS